MIQEIVVCLLPWRIQLRERERDLLLSLSLLHNEKCSNSQKYSEEHLQNVYSFEERKGVRQQIILLSIGQVPMACHVAGCPYILTTT